MLLLREYDLTKKFPPIDFRNEVPIRHGDAGGGAEAMARHPKPYASPKTYPRVTARTRRSRGNSAETRSPTSGKRFCRKGSLLPYPQQIDDTLTA